LDEFVPDEDGLVQSLIQRAREGWEEATQRAALVKTFDYYMDQVPDINAIIELPKAPLISVTSVKAYAMTENSDSGGTAMSTSGYYVDTANEFGRVQPLMAFSFPIATREINPMIIRFTAGYSTSTTGVPEGVKTEIKQLVAKLYMHRGDEAAMAEDLKNYYSELNLPTWG
jgi:uncharacterized phiE125 gp8 family phage protein